MKKNKIIKRLKKYFKENSDEQIKKDWDSTRDYDNIDSPTVKDFLKNNIKQ